MFGMSIWEIAIILAVALMVIGPNKLPELAKSLGRALGEFKRATSDFKESIKENADFDEIKGTFDDISKDIKQPIDLNVKEDANSKIADAKLVAPSDTNKNTMPDNHQKDTIEKKNG